MKKIIIFHVALLAVILAAATYGYVRYWNIATVNGKPITRLNYYRALDKQSGKQILDLMVEETLILNEAKAKNVSVSQADIDTAIATIETKISAQGQTLESALASAGMSKADLQKQIRLQKLEEKLSNPKTDVSQAEIDAFLKSNKDQLPTTYSKDELQTLAKNQLVSQAIKTAAASWLSALKQSAKVVYK